MSKGFFLVPLLFFNCLNGKSGVRIYIDGRPIPLTGQDLASYLNSLSSSMVESIELISNPSARFEAAGNAGIINIRLKKNTAMGTNAIVIAGLNMGKYIKYNSGINRVTTQLHL